MIGTSIKTAKGKIGNRQSEMGLGIGNKKQATGKAEVEGLDRGEKIEIQGERGGSNLLRVRET